MDRLCNGGNGNHTVGECTSENCHIESDKQDIFRIDCLGCKGSGCAFNQKDFICETCQLKDGDPQCNLYKECSSCNGSGEVGVLHEAPCEECDNSDQMKCKGPCIVLRALSNSEVLEYKTKISASCNIPDHQDDIRILSKLGKLPLFKGRIVTIGAISLPGQGG